MARFEAELPTAMVEELKRFERWGLSEMMDEMLTEAAERVEKNIRLRARRVFRNPDKVLRGLVKTKVYTSNKGDPVDEAKAVKIGFIGYVPNSPKTKRQPYGTPIPLIAQAREYGTSRGEAKKPFFRPSFNQSEIESIFSEVEEKYLPKED